YPRTDSDLITTSEFAYLKENLEDMKALLNTTINTPQTEPRTRYVNNAKVLEHYAIIPTQKLPLLNKLSEKEKNIYESILKHTLMMFMGDFLYEQTNLTLEVNGLSFNASGNVPMEKGWKALTSDESKKEK
ncbi:DNA topoisomerase, partial [Brochothrix campestris]